jgi:Membrane bound O-acyl transferase family
LDTIIVLDPLAWPRWAVMWALAFVIYAACKCLTWLSTPIRSTPVWKHVAYLLAWPGLDAATFLRDPPRDGPSATDWMHGALNLTAGLALFFGVARLVAPHNLSLAGWVGMAGVVVTLHFGLFHLLSCGWRAAGLEARPLMNQPLRSQSLGEFWGRRWNTAFRDLTHRFLFRPMTRWFGVRVGIAAGFIFSGLVHDLVISVPASGGYGGPTVFFTLQGAGILVERSAVGQAAGLGRGVTGWVFTMLMLIVPSPILFHPPFVDRIIIPFMQSLKAL